MKQTNKLNEVFSLMRTYGYRRNMYNGESEKVYRKTYMLKSNDLIPYIVTIVFDYRNINNDEVMLYAYDDTKGEYIDIDYIPLIEEFIIIINKLIDMELELYNEFE